MRRALEQQPTHGRATLALVVPTRNEADSIEPLLAELASALPARAAELIFVDDSDDATPDRIAAAARGDNRIRLIHRPAGDRPGGLGGAVAAGIAAAASTWVCVMDADLQHPPVTVARLLETAERDDVDLVVATRFGPGGATVLRGARRLVSSASAGLAHVLFPRRLRTISDPMSGFFLVRRSAVDVGALRPTGFKILLEILVRSRLGKTGEVSYVFGERRAGESKASLREGGRFLLHLLRLRFPEPTARLTGFAVIGLSGLIVNESLLAAFTEGAGFHYLASAVLATQAAIVWNFALTERWIYARRACRFDWRSRFASFVLICTTAQLLTTPILLGLVSLAGLSYLTANLVAIGASTGCRFALAESIIWRRAAPPDGLSERSGTPVPSTVKAAPAVSYHQSKTFRD